MGHAKNYMVDYCKYNLPNGKKISFCYIGVGELTFYSTS